MISSDSARFSLSFPPPTSDCQSQSRFLSLSLSLQRSPPDVSTASHSEPPFSALLRGLPQRCPALRACTLSPPAPPLSLPLTQLRAFNRLSSTPLYHQIVTVHDRSPCLFLSFSLQIVSSTRLAYKQDSWAHSPRIDPRSSLPFLRPCSLFLSCPPFFPSDIFSPQDKKCPHNSISYFFP